MPTLHHFNLSYSWNKNLHSTDRLGCPRQCSRRMRRVFQSREWFAHHPQDGARGLLHLLGSTPPGFDSCQPKISYFHCEAFMEKYICGFVKETAKTSVNSSVFSDLISKCCLFYWNLLGAACGAKEKGFYNEHLTLNQSRCCSIICRFIFMVSQDRNQQFIGCSSLNNWERETAHRSHNSEI